MTRPPLTLAVLRAQPTFDPHTVVVSRDDVTRYIALTGDDQPEYRRPDDPVLPVGLHPMLARLAYLGGHTMPPGGVMLGQTVTLHAHLHPDRPIRLAAAVEEVTTSGRHPRVRLRTTATRDDGTLAATVAITARWPDTDHP